MPGLSINNVTTFRWSFEEDIQCYSRHDISAIGIWRSKLLDIDIDAASAMLTDYDMEVSHLGWAGGFTGSDGRTFAESIDDAIMAIDIAAQFEAGCLLIHPGGRSRHTLNYAKRLFRDALRELLPVAEDFGVILAIEPMHVSCAEDFTWMNSIDSFLTLYEACDCSSLRLVLDTYHLDMTPGVLRQMEEMLPLVQMIQLGDWQDRIAGEQNRCFLGHGQVPLQDVIDMLTASGYDGYYDVELFGRDIDEHDYQSRLLHARQFYYDLVGTPQLKPDSLTETDSVL